MTTAFPETKGEGTKRAENVQPRGEGGSLMLYVDLLIN